MRRSFYNYTHRLDLLRDRIRESALCDDDKRLFLDFEKYLIAEGLTGECRRLKLLQIAFTFAQRYLQRPFRGATTTDIWRALALVEQDAGLELWTKRDYKITVKRIFKFVEWGESALRRRGYPESVDGIRARVRKRDQVKVKPSDLFEPEEIVALRNACTDAQVRALVSLVYESGGRISEIGLMDIADVTRDRYSYICHLEGKYGPREVRAIYSASALTAWLNAHPLRHDSGAPLWGTLKRGLWRPITYEQINKKFKQAAERAGITKRTHPHLFRHTRVTHLLGSNQMNEQQAKTFFGWSADSRQLRTYSHLVSRNANDAALRAFGIARRDEKPSPIQVVLCGMCHEPNAIDGKFCARCGYAIVADEVSSVERRVDDAGSLMASFLARPEVQDLLRAHLRDASAAPAEPTARPGGGLALPAPAARRSRPKEERSLERA